MSEPEKVLCPYCGKEMEPADEGIIPSFYPDWYYFVCPYCRSQSPWDRSPEGAYEEALKRHKPPQRPLTLEEVKALKFPFPLWIEYKEIRFDNGEQFHPEIVYGILDDGFVDIGYDWINPESCQSEFRFWRDRPTDEERKAASWEEAN